MENRIASREPDTAPSSRHEAILERLKTIASELAGIPSEYVSTDVHFFQAGIDSLLLLQAIQAVEKRMGVRVSLVELLEEITTLEALAGHLDALLPAETVLNGTGAPPPAAPDPTPTATATAAPAVPAPAPPQQVLAPPIFVPPVPIAPMAPGPAAGAPSAPEGARALERVIAQQLQLMQHQIAAIRGGQPIPAAPPQPSIPSIPATRAPSAPRTPSAEGSTTAPLAPAPAVPVPSEVPQSPRAKIQPETFVAYQPVSTEGPGGMTARQKAHVDDLIARFTARTKASKAHYATYQATFADGRATARFRRAFKEIAYPIVGERAKGSRVWDIDGNEYVDIGMAYGCNLFGHGPAFVDEAIREQVERGYGVGPQSAHAGRAAQLVCELGGVERAMFCNSGTEAVLGAIRAARTYAGRSKVAYFAGAYHGWSDVVQGRPLGSGERREVRPTAPGIPELPLGDVLILDWDQPSSLETLAKHLHEVAVVMVEPVQSRRPDIQPRAFLQELRRMTREGGALLHFDELITGFRIGAGGAQAHFGIEADLVTYGKIVAGGLPMGVVAGKKEVMGVFDGGLWSFGDDSYPASQRTLFAGAFFKHPLSMAVVCAIMEEIWRRGPSLYAELNAKADGLVGRMNGYFEAGGYPVTAVSFGSMFRFFFGKEVKYPELFNQHMVLEGIHVQVETGTGFLCDAHTEADLERVYQAVCRSVEAMRRGGLIPPAPSETEADGVRVVPLTEGQRQLIVESMMGDDAGMAYVESISLLFHGDLDVPALRRALQGLVDRHDTLRATFPPSGDVQHVLPRLEVEVPLVDFRAVAPEEREEREERVREWVRRTVRRPFDLQRGPLVRFSLAAVEEGVHRLVMDSHHAILDGWSFGVLMRDLSELYAAEAEGRAPELPPAPRHAELARTQAAVLHADPAAEAFWLEQFADGVPVLDLPTDRPRAAVRSYHGDRVLRVIGGGLMQRLAEEAGRNGLAFFHTLVAAVSVWLSRLSGQDDLVLGVPSAGQAARGAAQLVGYGINMLPVRVRVDGAAPFVEHARQVRRAILRGVEHQSFSLPRLVEKLLRTRDPGRPPLFSVMMNVDRALGESYVGGLRTEYESNHAGGSKLDLNLDITETADALRVSCDFSTALFDRETIERWLAAFERLLADVAERPTAPVSALEMVPDEELSGVVDAFCDDALAG